MPPQVRTHFIERLKRVGENLLVTPNDGVVRLGNVEVNGSVVGVDDGLDRVADIVAETAHGLGVRVVGGVRVGVANPVQISLAQDDVRVAVEE